MAPSSRTCSSPARTGALALFVSALSACGGPEGSPDVERVGRAAAALTCVTIQDQGPITTRIADAMIVTDPTDPLKASTNFGAVAQMTAGYGGADLRRILMRFDLAGAGVPAGATVSSATLSIKMVQSLGKNPVDVYAATAPWSEPTVTWNSFAAAPNGGLGALQITVPTLGVVNNSFVTVALPNALVTAWTDPSQNFGVVIDHPAPGRTVLGSSEAPQASRPKLDVCYEPPSCGDGAQNQGETGVDCGGPCASCSAGTIVPLYTYPTDPTWDTVALAQQAHPTVDVVAIINPSSGPGLAFDPAYASGIADLDAAGVTVIGYVATTYGNKPASAAHAEIDRYASFYPALRGVFLDEMSNVAGKEAYYAELDQYAKARGYPLTVGNPGTDTLASYVGTVDTMLVYESAGAPDPAALGGWHDQYAPSRFGVIPYAVPSLDPAFVAAARAHVGFVYVTTDDLPNPWDSLPPYFDALITALE